jgi:hypothetical protein
MAKNRVILITLLAIVIGVVSSFRTPTVSEVYVSQIGVQEHPKGSNWGKEISKYLRHVKTYDPQPWCAAFVRFCLDSAGVKSTITAYSPTAHNSKNLVWFKMKWYKEPAPGDVFTIYFASMGRIAHTGFFDHKVNSSICETVEGNTNNDGSREGYIVCRRKRSLHSLYSITRWQ